MRWPSWLKSKRTRDILAFVGAGLVAVAAGAWAVYRWINREGGQIEATYNVCRSDDPCPVGTVKIPCGGPSVGEWAKKECATFIIKGSFMAGGTCGTELIQVKCTAKR